MRYNSYYYIFLINKFEKDEDVLKSIKENIIMRYGTYLNRRTERGKDASKEYYYYKRLFKMKGREYVLRELEKYYAKPKPANEVNPMGTC